MPPPPAPASAGALTCTKGIGARGFGHSRMGTDRTGGEMQSALLRWADWEGSPLQSLQKRVRSCPPEAPAAPMTLWEMSHRRGERQLGRHTPKKTSISKYIYVVQDLYIVLYVSYVQSTRVK